MKFLLFLVLLAGLGAYLYNERRTNYPLESIVTPTGRAFKATVLSDECDDQPPCIRRLVYLTQLKDTMAIKEEARMLIAWAEHRRPSTGSDAITILALEPGFLQIAPPRAAHAVSFYRLTANTDWMYVGLEDRTGEIKRMLGGS